MFFSGDGDWQKPGEVSLDSPNKTFFTPAHP